ncbi:hypothetical protein OG896_06165 [Streptomyces sp. NBC_00669]|uniref:CU044_2847 family protein n=1 Tax=Streptomyces sp. NBC_00669 TaxID=2976011 RepID=UPI002E334FCA|nr:CU044_2847 family protein [Streptomyces sp. NBC_00669]
MPDFAELRLADDSLVRVELAPVGQPPSGEGEPDDLPDGFSAPVPVGRGAGAARLAAGTLRGVLRPIGLVLQEVQDSLSALDHPPQEVSVELGVQIGQDLKLGIVGANGQASMKVCATWRPVPAPAAVPAAVPGPAPAPGPVPAPASAPAASGAETPPAAPGPGAR